ncbi:ribose 5-phosphate isomerase A [Paenibacillus castaneae]|uniref:ribose-5-phosphate isomerase RpiA n=1 Tax=Paenibacillus castaneae TaxID=474957 RepID=UPI000C9A2A12|nr:ribose-5-phosphate isomerase RpiA [Paenibacillus castaneae]NIK76818.1 ribose 5-phosphate isomerase A [Paenibacillus castaneae]
MESKRLAAESAVHYIKDGMVIGLGTGSTAYWAIRKIGLRVQEGLQIRAVATSKQTEELAQKSGIPIITFAELPKQIDITIDGADEVDPNMNMIKGGGGALLREKIVATASSQMIVIVDQSKMVEHLGAFPLPVEIVPFGCEFTIRQIVDLGCTAILRMNGEEPFITDNGNYIADCAFGTISEPEQLGYQLNSLPGVVDNGLFIKHAHKIIVGYSDGTVKMLERN